MQIVCSHDDAWENDVDSVIMSQPHIIVPPRCAQAVAAFTHRRDKSHAGIRVLQENPVSNDALFPIRLVVFR